jgi:hypothetical protein
MTLIVKPGFNGMTDADAIAYVNAVEAADGQLLEFGVGKAINDFVVGCKLDNTWSAIKASCILAGARTLAGALVPLVGAAPTNVGPFVAEDYDRKTGLVGDGSTKYLNSNRNNNADPQNSKHAAVYQSLLGTPNTFATILGAGASGSGSLALISTASNRPAIRMHYSGNVSIEFLGAVTLNTGFFGASRSSATNVIGRANNQNGADATASVTPAQGDILVFARNNVTTGAATAGTLTNARLAFCSIGESLDLALLDARVSALITAFGVAIP